MRRLLRSRLALGALALVLVSAAATTVALATLRHPGGDRPEVMCLDVAYMDGILLDLGLHVDTKAFALSMDAIERRLIRRHASTATRQRAVERHLRATLPVRRVAVCAGGRCRDISLRQLGYDMFSRVPPPQRGAAPFAVTVVVEDRDRRVHLASGILRPRITEPNGRGCGIRWLASGRVDGSVVRDTSS